VHCPCEGGKLPFFQYSAAAPSAIKNAEQLHLQKSWFFCQIFEDFLIVTKKQHITLNFDSNNNLVPFDTLVDPDAEKVRNEKLWRAFKPVCTVPSGKKLNPS
jgi:hypothetical protein